MFFMQSYQTRLSHLQNQRLSSPCGKKALMSLMGCEYTYNLEQLKTKHQTIAHPKNRMLTFFVYILNK